jgi:hypothetical protein
MLFILQIIFKNYNYNYNYVFMYLYSRKKIN